MRQVIVASDPRDWPLRVGNVEVVAAHTYLTDPEWSSDERVRVFNLCRSHRYQRLGYYVSLLAEARGHRPLPSIATIQDLKLQTVISAAGEELDELIQRQLSRLKAEKFELSVYFGRNVAKHYDELSQQLFRRFRAPLLRAFFSWSARNKRWLLQNINAIGVSDIPETHLAFAAGAAEEYFASKQRAVPVRSGGYDLAILWNAAEEEPASDERAIRRFERAAAAEGLNTERIGREDYPRLSEFDALFIRETTAVNHHTFRFARRALAEGLVVIDDPDSILRCSNKVFLAEVLARHKLPAPRTLIVHRGNVDKIEPTLGLPCVLKQPDSAFSQGVKKVEDSATLASTVEELLENSQLIVAQEFLPTEFDWRVGVLDRQPLYACRYFMARRHWQIIRRHSDGTIADDGAVQAVPVEMAPTRVIRAAVRAAGLMGDGFYGVDLKQIGDEVYVIEANDNPSIDAGIEDAVLRDELYRIVMRVFRARIEQKKARGKA